MSAPLEPAYLLSHSLKMLEIPAFSRSMKIAGGVEGGGGGVITFQIGELCVLPVHANRV